jgi:hypothetical protein
MLDEVSLSDVSAEALARLYKALGVYIKAQKERPRLEAQRDKLQKALEALKG